MRFVLLAIVLTGLTVLGCGADEVVTPTSVPTPTVVPTSTTELVADTPTPEPSPTPEPIDTPTPDAGAVTEGQGQEFCMEVVSAGIAAVTTTNLIVDHVARGVKDLGLLKDPDFIAEADVISSELHRTANLFRGVQVPPEFATEADPIIEDLATVMDGLGDLYGAGVASFNLFTFRRVQSDIAESQARGEDLQKVVSTVCIIS